MTSAATRVGDVCDYLQTVAPLELAEDWDNVGLLIDRRDDEVTKIATCLTLSPDVVADILRQKVSMVVSHHPLPFRPMAKLTDDAVASSLVLDLIRGGVAVYSAHTAFDSAAGGINALWMSRLDIENTTPLIPHASDSSIGSGRVGDLPSAMSVAKLAGQCGDAERVRFTGPADRMVRRVAVACGSGGGFIGDAIAAKCDAFITGEATYHQCLEAMAADVAVVMTGHFASERFAMEDLAKRLAEAFVDCEVFAAEESDVVQSRRVGS